MRSPVITGSDLGRAIRSPSFGESGGARSRSGAEQVGDAEQRGRGEAKCGEVRRGLRGWSGSGGELGRVLVGGEPDGVGGRVGQVDGLLV